MRHAVKHVHFVGIAGVGMSGIAEVLSSLGYTVSGSDVADNAAAKRLKAQGIRVDIGHAAAQVHGADAVVVSTAVPAENPEVAEARALRIPVVPRAVMLAELMRFKCGIAIAGTHGKTTTTSLVTSVLAEAELDPTFVIGGRLNSLGAHAKLGAGDYIVVEADESDASFLNLFPMMAVVTNIDADHMDTYGHDFEKLKAAFVGFLNRMPFYGRAFMCIDDAATQSIAESVNCPVTGYGFSEQAQVRAFNVRAVEQQMHFTVQRRNGQALPNLDIRLNLVGEHNVRNALAAIAIASELNVADRHIQKALSEFKGVGRRFQYLGECQNDAGENFSVIDDYGHHPVEMRATLGAARAAYPDRRIVLVFQPHRYTRTRDCFEDFVQAMAMADAVFLTEVYPAGEAPIVAADGRSLSRALRVATAIEPVFIESVQGLNAAVKAGVQAGDVVLYMGAGSISTMAHQLVEGVLV